MTDTHYWVGENTDFVCKNCATILHISVDFIGGQYSKTYNYIYPNGDTSTVFVNSLKDICPIEFDSGKWLPGAIEIPLSHVGLEIT